jgi:hypothetical protein
VSLISELRKFSSRTWRERGFFAEAYMLLGVMRCAMLLLPFQRIAEIMGLRQGIAGADNAFARSVNSAHIGWAIQAAALRTPWESACLVQALTGVVMLGRQGIDATLYLGVAKDESGLEAMSAHAWLCCGDAIVTGDSGIERFSVISSFSRSPETTVSRKHGPGRM